MENNDLLIDFVSLVDDSSLHSLLLTSKTLAVAVIPRLYRNITASPAVFVDASQAKEPSQAWGKISAILQVRQLRIPTHSETDCAGNHILPDLPFLQHLHLSGGPFSLVEGRLCQPHSCGIIERYKAVSRVTIRRLHLMPEMTVPHVVVILRPCQFPFDPRGAPTYCAGTFRPLAGVETVDIVLWDERHDYRIDWIEHPAVGTLTTPTTRPDSDEVVDGPTGNTPLGAKGHWESLPGTSYKTKGCTYCDQSGCVRYTPNIPRQLPSLVYSVTRWTSAKTVRVWNAEKSVEEFSWHGTETGMQKCRETVKQEAERGQVDREAMSEEPPEEMSQDVNTATTESEGEMGGLTATNAHRVQVEIGTVEDYVDMVRRERWCLEDADYWSMTLKGESSFQ